jgi:hypothetical protein
MKVSRFYLYVISLILYQLHVQLAIVRAKTIILLNFSFGGHANLCVQDHKLIMKPFFITI